MRLSGVLEKPAQEVILHGWSGQATLPRRRWNEMAMLASFCTAGTLWVNTSNVAEITNALLPSGCSLIEYAELLEPEIELRDVPRAQAKQEVLSYVQAHPHEDSFDIALALRLDFDLTHDVCEELVREGALAPSSQMVVG